MPEEDRVCTQQDRRGCEIIMIRNRLPDRRSNITTVLLYDGRSYSVTLGFDPNTGILGEVFMHGAKVGSAMDGILDDACILLSLLLQHGIDPVELPASMGYLGDGKTPASILGVLIKLIAGEVKSDHCNG